MTIENRARMETGFQGILGEGRGDEGNPWGREQAFAEAGLVELT